MTEQQAGVPAVSGVTRWRVREPVSIDAIEWTGNNEEAIRAFIGDAGTFEVKVGGFAVAWNRATGGCANLALGYWIARGVTGIFFGRSAEDFAATYEPADAALPVAAEAVPDTEGMRARQIAEAVEEGWLSEGGGRAMLAWLESARARPRVSEDFRIRLARAMYESLDRCARCKVCEHQIGAASKVMAEAVSAERDRARRAEGKLNAIAAYCRKHPELAGAGFPQLAWDILAITGSEEEASNG